MLVVKVQNTCRPKRDKSAPVSVLDFCSLRGYSVGYKWKQGFFSEWNPSSACTEVGSVSCEQLCGNEGGAEWLTGRDERLRVEGGHVEDSSAGMWESLSEVKVQFDEWTPRVLKERRSWWYCVRLLCLCCGSVLFRTCGFFSGVFSYTSAHTGLCKSCLLSLLVSRLELHAGGQFKAIHLLWLQPKPFCVRNVESTTLLIPAGLHRPLPTQAGSGGAVAAQPVM